MASTAELLDSPRQQLFATVSVYLLEHLRAVFESCEAELLEEGEQSSLCCDLRRNRRTFIDGYINQLGQRCDSASNEWVTSTATNASKARTLIYLSEADLKVRDLYQEHAVSIGRLVAVWNQQFEASCTVFDCPFSPHTLTRLFFLLLPDLPAPLRIRYKLAVKFMSALPRFFQTFFQAIFNILQRRGVLVAGVSPLAMPEWWESLERARQPSVAAQALVVTPRSVERLAELAREVATAALEADQDRLQTLLLSERQTSLLPWLVEQIGSDSHLMPPTSRKILSLLAGPLLHAACDESFADSAHPARRVLEELRHWVPGWQECMGIAGVVPEYCEQLSASLAELLLQKPEMLMHGWQELLDYLLQLQKRLQQDVSAVVASTRLSLQVVEVRVEVDALLAERAALEYWPQIVVDIIHDYWSALLLEIHWREGTASDLWLRAIAVADELLASVQPGLDRQTRANTMRKVSQLLQGLRKGFDALGCQRSVYAALLERLESVHLALLKGREGDELPEANVLWPGVARVPMQDDPFEVGNWLQRDDGAVMSVEFSDRWCTALRDAHNAALVCYATAALQVDFYEGCLIVLPPVAGLLPISA